MTKARGDKGRQGEALAAQFLVRHGYSILAQNYRVPAGEVDIIAQEQGTLVFVEVKARTGTSFGTPAEAVTPRKRRQIAKAALTYLGQNGAMDRPARFDVVSVVLGGEGSPRIELIRNAFDLSGCGWE